MYMYVFICAEDIVHKVLVKWILVSVLFSMLQNFQGG